MVPSHRFRRILFIADLEIRIQTNHQVLSIVVGYPQVKDTITRVGAVRFLPVHFDVHILLPIVAGRKPRKIRKIVTIPWRVKFAVHFTGEVIIFYPVETKGAY